MSSFFGSLFGSKEEKKQPQLPPGITIVKNPLDKKSPEEAAKEQAGTSPSPTAPAPVQPAAAPSVTLFQGMALKPQGTGGATSMFQNLNTKTGTKPLFGQGAPGAALDFPTGSTQPTQSDMPTEAPVAAKPAGGFNFIKKAQAAQQQQGGSKDLLGVGTSPSPSGGGFQAPQEDLARTNLYKTWGDDNDLLGKSNVESEPIGFGLSSLNYVETPKAEAEPPAPAPEVAAPPVKKGGFGFIGKKTAQPEAQLISPTPPPPPPAPVQYQEEVQEEQREEKVHLAYDAFDLGYTPNVEEKEVEVAAEEQSASDLSRQFERQQIDEAVQQAHNHAANDTNKRVRSMSKEEEEIELSFEYLEKVEYRRFKSKKRIHEIISKQNALAQTKLELEAQKTILQGAVPIIQGQMEDAISKENYELAERLDQEISEKRKGLVAIENKIRDNLAASLALQKEKTAVFREEIDEAPKIIGDIMKFQAEHAGHAKTYSDRESAQLKAEKEYIEQERDRLRIAKSHIESDFSHCDVERGQIDESLSKLTHEMKEQEEGFLKHKTELEATIEALERELIAKRAELKSVVGCLEDVTGRIKQVRGKFEGQLSKVAQRKKKIQEEEHLYNGEFEKLSEMIRKTTHSEEEYNRRMGEYQTQQKRMQDIVQGIEDNKSKLMRTQSRREEVVHNYSLTVISVMSRGEDLDKIAVANVELEQKITSLEQKRTQLHQEKVQLSEKVNTLENEKKAAVAARNFKAASQFTAESKDIVAKIESIERDITSALEKEGEMKHGIQANNAKAEDIRKTLTEMGKEIDANRLEMLIFEVEDLTQAIQDANKMLDTEMAATLAIELSKVRNETEVLKGRLPEKVAEITKRLGLEAAAEAAKANATSTQVDTLKPVGNLLGDDDLLGGPVKFETPKQQVQQTIQETHAPAPEFVIPAEMLLPPVPEPVAETFESVSENLDEKENLLKKLKKDNDDLNIRIEAMAEQYDEADEAQKTIDANGPIITALEHEIESLKEKLAGLAPKNEDTHAHNEHVPLPEAPAEDAVHAVEPVTHIEQHEVPEHAVVDEEEAEPKAPSPGNDVQILDETEEKETKTADLGADTLI